MRVKSKVNVQIYETTAQTDALFKPDDTNAEVNFDTYNEQASGRFALAASGSTALSLGTVTAVAGIYIRTTGNFDVVINGGDTIQIRRPANSTNALKFYMDGVVTSVTITNASGTAALAGWYAIWGD